MIFRNDDSQRRCRRLLISWQHHQPSRESEKKGEWLSSGKDGQSRRGMRVTRGDDWVDWHAMSSPTTQLSGKKCDGKGERNISPKWLLKSPCNKRPMQVRRLCNRLWNPFHPSSCLQDFHFSQLYHCQKYDLQASKSFSGVRWWWNGGLILGTEKRNEGKWLVCRHKGKVVVLTKQQTPSGVQKLRDQRESRENHQRKTVNLLPSLGNCLQV